MKMDVKSKLSLLWVFVLFNMAYADILSLMDATSAIRVRMSGTPMSSGILLVGAILMETAIMMVVLSRFLPFKINKWANIVIAVINIIAVVTGGHGIYYFFFVAIEVLAMLIIIWIAWKWKEKEPELAI